MYRSIIHLIDELPKTKEAGLHLLEPSVVAFMNHLANTPDDKIMSVIDEMFVHYTSVIRKYQEELDKKAYTYTPEQVKQILERGKL